MVVVYGLPFAVVRGKGRTRLTQSIFSLLPNPVHLSLQLRVSAFAGLLDGKRAIPDLVIPAHQDCVHDVEVLGYSHMPSVFQGFIEDPLAQVRPAVGLRLVRTRNDEMGSLPV